MLRDASVSPSCDTSPNPNEARQRMPARRLSRPGAIMGLMILVCWFAPPGWGYSGGSGSLQSPYLIASADDLIELGQTPEDYGKHFLLTADIDLSGHSFDRAVIAPSSRDAWVEIHDGDVFSGTINGDGHVIRNLTISGLSNLGLIGIMGPYAQVYGLGIVDASIVGTEVNVGMLAAYNDGRISSCYGTGSINGTTQVGGLVGENHGTIENSYTAGTVSGMSDVGGLAGRSFGAGIVNCYSSCAVTADSADASDAVGGLVGSGRNASGCFWDIETSGISDNGIGTGLNTDQMHALDVYVEAGWDFQGEVANGCREIWLIPEGGGYPILSIFADLASVLPANCDVTLGLCMLPLDANDVLWDATASFTPNWDSVAISRLTQNPVEYPDNDPNERDVVVTLSGKIEILDANNLIALDAQNSILCQAMDGQGDNVALRHFGSPFEPRHCWNILNTSPRPFTLQLQLAPNQAIPGELSQLDFYVYALYAQPLMTLDIPFKPMEDWTELWPGFRMIIETAVSEDGKCEFTIKEEITGLTNSDNELRRGYDLCDPDEGGWYGHEDAFTGRDLIYNREIIDAAGMPTSRRGGSTSSSSHSSGEGTQRTESGDWDECSGIEFIRYTVAVKPHRVLVPLTLTDIPVAGL